MAQPFIGPVVEIDEGLLDVGRQRRRIDGVAMVLRCDDHVAAAAIHNGLVASPVSVLELVGLRAERFGQELMSQADAEHGQIFMRYRVAQGSDDALQACRIAGAIAHHETVKAELVQMRACRVAGNLDDLRAAIGETPHDVLFRAAVQQADAERTAAFGVIARDGNGAHERRRVERFAEIPRERSGRISHRTLPDRQDRPHRAGFAQARHERSRVDALDPAYPALVEPLRHGSLAAVVIRVAADAFEDRSRDADGAMLANRRIEAVIADQRITKNEDLPRIGRIGERLLVARHAGVEDRLALRGAFRTDAAAAIGGAVGEQQQGRSGDHVFALAAGLASALAERSPSRMMTLPPTTTSAGLTAKVMPANGVTRPFERKSLGSTVHGRCKYSPVMSAGEPGASVPPGTCKSAAGLVEKFATMTASGSCGSAWKVAATATSSPVKPTQAWANGASFSSAACGAWSLAKTVMIPSATACRSAAVSAADRSGGF